MTRRPLKSALLVLLIILLALTSMGGLILAREDVGNGPPAFAKIIFVHYGRPAGKGGNTPTDQVTDYKYTGVRWPDDAPNISFTVDPANRLGIPAAAVQGAIDSAAAAWHAADAKVTFTDAGLAALTVDPRAAPDSKNTVSFRSISAQYPNAIAVTYGWYYVNTKRLFEVDTIFNDDLAWSVNAYGASFSGSYDVQNIATHEIGHWLVLGDLYKTRDAELTMYGYGAMGETKKDTLGVGDILGINNVYP